jgi:hypothetical protein
METFFKDALKLYQDRHAQAVNAFDSLPPEALDWRPYAAANSIGVLVVHLTGSERFLMGDIVMGQPSGRDREAEFRANGLTADDLKRRIEEAEGYMRRVFESLSLPDLEKERLHPRTGKMVSFGWAVMHGLEHAAEHIGEIEAISQFWREKHPG